MVTAEPMEKGQPYGEKSYNIGVASTVMGGDYNESGSAILCCCLCSLSYAEKNDRMLRMYKRRCTHCIGLTTETDCIVQVGRD